MEAGYLWTITPVFFAELQVHLAYGRLQGDEITEASNGERVKQENFECLVGRIGARIGARLPQDVGSTFVRSSLNHDFQGEANGTATPAKGDPQHLGRSGWHLADIQHRRTVRPS